ncbi:PAS domain S-box protein [Herbaspirillum sp. GCM10030257]|uniref:sensor domain-containing diguanylate cyclase n=1 Tax=Herbaspirillum sp. GCM10030257 TaxID=3273393 RepID=UPI00361ECEE8
MESLIALAADLHWETDANCRFTVLKETANHSADLAETLRPVLGTRLWEQFSSTPSTALPHDVQSIVEQRTTFRALQWAWSSGQKNDFIFEACGEPVFDGQGVFAGYRGLLRDVTAYTQEVRQLRRFRDAVDISGDPIFLIDRATMRIIDFNDTACQTTGYTRTELLAIGPHDLLVSDRETIEHEFDELIASGTAMTTERTAMQRDGSTQLFELQRRAILLDGHWVIVTSARNMTRRMLAEAATARLGQMYAAISGTNEAILHARNPAELYQQVCEVAVGSGQIVNASVLLPDNETQWAKVTAVAGMGADTLRSLKLSFDSSKPEGRGLVGTAFATCSTCVINDLSSDPRVSLWRSEAGKEGALAGAAIPLLRNAQPVGVLLLYSREKGAFDDEIVGLLERMARNIVFTLDNFELEVRRQKAVDALRQSEERYRSILENMNDGYFEVDLKGNYTAVNEALCRQHHCAREEVLKLNYRHFMDAATAAYVYRVYNRIYRTGQSAELTEHTIYRHDGNIGIVQTSIQVVTDDQGKRVGFRGISRDVTARRLAEEAVRASEEKYRSILESIEEAYYEVDLGGGLVLCNDAFCRMFGYSMNEVVGLNYRHYHSPDDTAHVFANFNDVFKTGIPKKGIDWRLLHRNGQEIMCEGSIHLIRDASGEPVGFRGMLRDVTDRRGIETALRESEERFRDLTRVSSDWYWEQDNRYRFIQINGDVFGKTGMVADHYLGKTLWELPFDNVSRDQWIEHQSLLAEGRPFHELVLRLPGKDGAARYLSISGLPVKDSEGRVVGYRGIGKDITERKLADERIRHLASHDILTGLPNRMMFHQVLGYQILQARRYDRKFALMFIDLDHFKTINDGHGHDAGDVVLKETAKRLSDNVRNTDLVARLAGDEFVIIIQDHGSDENLRMIADKLIAAIRAPISLGDMIHTVTASIGVSVYPDHGEDEGALLKQADAAMYLVKHGNKNDVRMA